MSPVVPMVSLLAPVVPMVSLLASVAPRQVQWWAVVSREGGVVDGDPPPACSPSAKPGSSRRGSRVSSQKWLASTLLHGSAGARVQLGVGEPLLPRSTSQFSGVVVQPAVGCAVRSVGPYSASHQQ